MTMTHRHETTRIRRVCLPLDLLFLLLFLLPVNCITGQSQDRANVVNSMKGELMWLGDVFSSFSSCSPLTDVLERKTRETKNKWARREENKPWHDDDVKRDWNLCRSRLRGVRTFSSSFHSCHRQTRQSPHSFPYLRERSREQKRRKKSISQSSHGLKVLSTKRVTERSKRNRITTKNS